MGVARLQKFYILNIVFIFFITGSVFLKIVEAQTETIEYPKLRAQMRQWDCDDAKRPSETFCRVRQMPSVEKVSRQIAADVKVWNEGEMLTVVYQAQADAVEVVVGGANYPMASIGGTDFWAIVLQAPRLESGIVSYQFIITQGDQIKSDSNPSRFIWRGGRAPAAPAQAKPLQGKVTEETIQSVNLSEPRKLVVYSPPLQRKGKKPAFVVYAADGGNVHRLAPYVDHLIAAGKLPPVLLVGVNPGDRVRDPDPQVSDVRAIEYVRSYGKTPERYDKHERFFVEEVLRWAETKYNAPKKREKRGIFGYSSGSVFAITTGTKHYNTFGHVFGFSGSLPPDLFTPAWTDKKDAPVYYLVAGLWEHQVRARLPKNAETLKKYGAKVTYVEPIAEHDATMRDEQFAQALLLHFGGGV